MALGLPATKPLLLARVSDRGAQAWPVACMMLLHVVARLALGLLTAACMEVASLALGPLAVACMELCGRQSPDLRHRNPLHR